MRAEILCLGNELLIGRTVNTNTTFLSLELTKLGHKVTHSVMVMDDKEMIKETLQWMEAHSPDIILISGGLGPTYDDIQLETIAEYIGVEFVENAEAIEMIKANPRVKKLTPEIRKMGTFPKGSKPLHNSVGTAPGAITEHKGIILISLPGVPSEMKAIFTEEVIPILKEKFGTAKMKEMGFSARGVGESGIVDLTERVRRNFPGLYFKSHPQRDETGFWLSLHVYSTDPDKADQVQEACEMWRSEIMKRTQDVSEVYEVFTDDFQGEFKE